MDEDLMSKSVADLTQEEKDFLYKRLLTLFLEHNSSELASEATNRLETQVTVFYFLNLLDQK